MFTPAPSIKSASRGGSRCQRASSGGARQVRPCSRMAEWRVRAAAGSAGAAGDVERRDVPLVAPHELSDGARRRTPPRVRRPPATSPPGCRRPRRFFGGSRRSGSEILRVPVGYVRRGSLGLRRRGIVVVRRVAQRRSASIRRTREMADQRATSSSPTGRAVAHGQRIAHEELRLVGQQLLRRRHGSRGLVAGARQPELAGAPVDQAVQREIPPEPQRLACQLCRHPEIVAHHCPTYWCR